MCPVISLLSKLIVSSVFISHETIDYSLIEAPAFGSLIFSDLSGHSLSPLMVPLYLLYLLFMQGPQNSIYRLLSSVYITS